MDEIVNRPVLFRIWVMNHAFWNDRWEVVGSAPVETSLLEEPKFAKVDQISGATSIYYIDKEIPASKEEFKGLERAAVWEPEHVESRLDDHFANRPNIWVERFKID